MTSPSSPTCPQSQTKIVPGVGGTRKERQGDMAMNYAKIFNRRASFSISPL